MSVDNPMQAGVGGVSSPDGRSFRLRDSDLALRAGHFVSVDDGTGVEHQGFLEAVEEDPGATVSGHGYFVSTGGDAPRFRSGSVRPSSAAEITRVFTTANAALRVGTLVDDPAVSTGLIAARLNRHTFWCGQSGSGKTYALGVALEQIRLHTRLPMVVFDFNSDFVRFGESVPGVDPEVAGQLAARPVRVLGRGADAEPLRARLRSLDLASRGAVLQLDPVQHRDEFNAMVRHNPTTNTADIRSFVHSLQTSDDPGSRSLARRVENLGLLDWRIWALDRPAVTDVLDDRPPATVLDLGSLGRREEQLAVALCVLDDLWQRREDRRPLLVVIDEAHNLCSPDLESLAGRAVRDRIVQIAAEGRKYGLWLLLSTQRPSKVHPGIISQCDNLALMRMNSPNDLAELADLFGFVPRQLLNRSPRFHQGEALLAGGFVPAPTIARISSRLTVEGGIDVRVPMP